MKTLQVAQTTYTTYELTDAEVFALNIFLDIDVSYAVISRRENLANTEAQLVLAIKWWRTRFPECGSVPLVPYAINRSLLVSERKPINLYV